MSRWIGLTGKMGAGKDHAFNTMAKLLPINIHPPVAKIMRASFADTLRFEIEDALNDGRPLRPIWEKPYSEEVRRLLQWWGTDLRRAEDPDYWVRNTIARIQKDLETIPAFKGASPVFTDVRFPNEAAAIVDRGGIIVRVVASPEVRAARLGFAPPEHASETAMDEHDSSEDYILVSDGRNPEGYEEQIRDILTLAGVEL